MLLSKSELAALTFWVDAQLSPSIAKWLIDTFGVKAFSLRALNLLAADDLDIYLAAKDINAIIISKDRDLLELIRRLGSPPKLIWLRCGNTSNAMVRRIMKDNFDTIIEALIINQSIFIEISN